MYLDVLKKFSRFYTKDIFICIASIYFILSIHKF